MSPIFISYRRSDAGGHAVRVFERLRGHFGEQYVFFDQDAIEPGDHFPDHIEKAIRSTAVVLVVIGPNWLDELNERAANRQTDFVRQEVSIAVERKRSTNDRIELIPLLVGDATMPARDQLHADLRDPIGPLFCFQAHALQGPQRDQDGQFKHLLALLADVSGVAPRASMANAGERPVLSIHASTTRSRASGSVDQITLPPIVIDEVERAFRLISRMLLDWPQETAGHWIERPELPRLRELTTRSSPSVTILLGGPGEGKSAILARLGALLVKDGAVLLAIKADRIPRDVSSLRHLDAWIDCGAELAATLCGLAEKRRVVLLIDQLDALGDLMDQHTGRLSALFRLVQSVRDTPNLHVIVSCREFEFRHDVRLNTLGADKVTLAPVQWDQVLPVLSARKVDTERWSEEVRAVLCTPHNLAIYLELLVRRVPVPDFTSYQALLDRVIRERLELVYGDVALQAAERIAAEMAAEEEPSLARARFSDLPTELESLESAGVLLSSEDGLRVSFRHQTLLDVLRARSFLRQGTSLAHYVLDQRLQSLFVRPTVWSTLNYLRASDTPTYRREFLRMWRYRGLRLHLRYLLISFLGQVVGPTDEEAGWLLSKLEAPDTRPRALWGMASNAAGWLPRLSSRLPQHMTEPPPQAWPTAALLAGAINQQRDTVLGLLQRHWMIDSTYLHQVLHVLCDLQSWDPKSFSLATACVDRVVEDTPGDTLPIHRLMEAIARSSMDLAFKLVVYFLQATTERIADGSPDDGADRGSWHHRSQKYEPLLRDSIWYEIGELSDKHPRAFIAHAWSWFIGVFERLRGEHMTLYNAYQGHHGLTFFGAPDESDYFQKTFERAIRGFAEDYPDAFLRFVAENEGSDLNVIHRLLALGLERLAPGRPRAVLQYLLGDPRRLAIGERWYDEEAAHSVSLITALAPELALEDAQCLEDAILEWQYYRGDAPETDAESRLHRRTRSRKLRLSLLHALPFERLSSEGRRYMQEEDRAFPPDSAWDSRTRDVRMRAVESPMSAAQMEKARSEDILRLFETLTDATQWHHPTRSWPIRVGGSIQASRQFAEFAKASPDRALRIIDSFEPGKTERPAGDALAALGSTDVPAGTLIECIRRLDRRGFASESFRIDAARCLREVARRSRGLDDETCELLEGWITERSSPTDDGVAGWDEASVTEGDSILWDRHGLVSLPQGNYPILDALMLGYLLRDQPHPSGWLGVLERHLSRDEDPRVWCALTQGMPHLANDDGDRAIKFFNSLFARFPTILNTQSGVLLIGQIVDRLPSRMVNGILDGWTSGDWTHGPQAAGEVAALRLCRQPDRLDARAQVERSLSGLGLEQEVVEGLRVGLTYTFARAWHHPELRPLSTRLMVDIVSTAPSSVAVAVHSVFRVSSPFPADAYTRELLEAVLEQPSVLVGRAHFLVKGMKDLLYEDGYPILAYKVAIALVEQTARSGSGVDAAQNLSDLVDLALTLHRIPDTREHGLDLFERLLEANAPGLPQSLTMIDRPAFR